MPSFRVPLSIRVLDPDPAGPIRTILRAAVRVEARTRHGWFAPIRTCLVDTGASYTMMSADHARWLDLELPETVSHAPLRTAVGSAASVVRDGELRLRFPQLPGHTFRLYCVFFEKMERNTPLLLGLNDFLDVFRVTFDGRHSPDAPAGHMLFETA